MRPDVLPNRTLDPDTLQVFTHFPRAFMEGGALKTRYKNKLEFLKTFIFKNFALEYTEDFGPRLVQAARSLHHIPGNTIPLSPGVSMQRTRSQSAATPTATPARAMLASTRATPAAPTPPPAPTPHPTPSSTLASSPLSEGCPACVHQPASGQPFEIGERGYARTPILLAQLALNAAEEGQVVALLSELPPCNLYVALTALDFCPLHACRLSDVAITDKAAGFPITAVSAPL